MGWIEIKGGYDQMAARSAEFAARAAEFDTQSGQHVAASEAAESGKKGSVFGDDQFGASMLQSYGPLRDEARSLIGTIGPDGLRIGTGVGTGADMVDAADGESAYDLNRLD